MEERTENDHTLVNAYKAGDIKAFELLYLKYTNKMKGVAYRYVGNSAEAEDIIQEVSTSRTTERGTRADDKRSEAAMEDRKKAGYF